VALAAGWAVLGWAALARAETPDPPARPPPSLSAIALAEALFRAGREAMAQEDYDSACPKFAESQHIDPKPGTLINLALCDERQGRTATAWGEYLQTARLARAANQSDRERVALERARALEPALAHVTIRAGSDPAMLVTLDGAPITTGGLNAPIPVDPGEHVVGATRPGSTAFSASVVVAPDGSDVTVVVPALQPEAPPVLRAAPAPVVLRPVHARADASNATRTWGYVSAGAGLALLGVGVYFGLRAFSEKATAENECDSTFCTPAGFNAISALKTAEGISTFTALGGITAVGAGVALILTAKPKATPSPSLSVGLGGAALGLRAKITW
jgi:tetratricopeptide (TPR) repeat protein